MPLRGAAVQLGNASIDHLEMTLEISKRPSLPITSDQLTCLITRYAARVSLWITVRKLGKR